MCFPQQTDQPTQLDWARLIELEPRLQRVEASAIAVHAPGLPDWAAGRACSRPAIPDGNTL